MPHDIFLSYAREDLRRVKPVVDALATRGWSVWWDRTIIPGQTFDSVIEAALDSARCVVVLWSQDAVKPQWVRTEADEGQRRGVLIPALLDDVVIPLAFRRIQAANLVGWSGALPHAGFEDLARAVEGILGTPAARRAASATAASPPPAAAPASRAEPVELPRPVPPPARQEHPTVAAAPEGWRNPRSWMIAGALGVLAVGTTIYLARAPKGGTSHQPPAAAEKSPTYVAAPVAPPAGSTKKAEAENPPPAAPRDVTSGAKAAPKSSPTAETRYNPKDGLKYVYIPAGKFIMGCSPGDSECNDWEKPPHEVTITRGFWLGQTPVTQEAYQRVIGNNPSNFKGARLPVEKVNWNEALAYCKAVQMRLPTEAEWEYAARAGSAGARYGSPDQIAWYSWNSEHKTHEVGQKQPNAFGLYDMLGNVSQWVEDDWAFYAGGTADGCAGCKVLRGGSWSNDPGRVRASFRSLVDPTVRNDGIGFRCAGELR